MPYFPARNGKKPWNGAKFADFLTWVIYFVGCKLISIIYVAINMVIISFILIYENGNKKQSRASIWLALEPSKFHLLFCFWAFLRLFSRVPLLRKSHRRNPLDLIRREWSNITLSQNKEWKTGIIAFRRSLRFPSSCARSNYKKRNSKKEKSPGIFLRHMAKIFHIGS